MFSLLVTLFFSITGITLNHPEWLLGGAGSKREVTGTLPAGWRSGKGVGWLVVSEHLRKAHGVRGSVADRRSDEYEGSLSFKAPGYGADCFFDLRTGKYQLTIASQGWLGVINDLHRGRDSGRTWAWMIDASAIILCIVSLSGIALLLYLNRVRVSALVAMTAGGVLLLALMRIAARA
jgi:hypothetical protein